MKFRLLILLTMLLSLPLSAQDAQPEKKPDKATQVPWNYLVGGQWDVNRSFSILAEFGFGKRKSQMLNLTYRF
jgi:hypothetical protein